MSLDPRRAALWDRLQLGPQWVLRVPTKGEWVGEGVGGELIGAELDKPAHTTPSAAPAASSSDAIAVLDWDALQARVAACTACGLCKSRKQTVFGTGHRAAPWLIVGEAPGADEDARGEPFVGQAGKLLDNMLAAVQRSRSRDDERAVYIANVLKCRPPGNRNPEPHEVESCAPFLQRQIELLQPRVILIMGRFAAQSLLGTTASIASLRSRIHQVSVGERSIPAVVTYHPAYLLRNLVDKAKSWQDLQLALQAEQKYF